ncbi:MAG: cysteine synthase A [Myxococcota bacterium]|jgi:cysteine synthase A|nr:cysteine synthase A [Myxococcota bacterium]
MERLTSTSPHDLPAGEDQITDLLGMIGNTPLLQIDHPHNGNGAVYAKAEFVNPGGSIKDRIARHLILTAQQEGKLRPGMVIAEATSGNTGIGVAMVGRALGYRVVIVMPESMSEERKKLVRALGADLILTPREASISGAVEKVAALERINPNIWRVNQFDNPHNPEVHYQTTGPELWRQLGGRIDGFVAGVGSGGTLQGVGRYLKERNPAVQIIAVEPDGFSALLGLEPGLHVIHQIQGIGDGFIPSVLDPGLIDDVITVSDDDAVYCTRKLSRTLGLLVGTSAGANVYAARILSARLGPGSRVATVLPDRAERYFSTALL